MALNHWLQLALTEGIGPILIRRIIDRAGSAETACNASVTLLREIEGIGCAKANTIIQSLRLAHEQVEPELQRASAAGIQLISPDDSGYPMLLKEIPDPPAVLYMKGTLEDRDLNALAIVGSRRCSYYGREQAERFGALLAGSGFTVLSGGARGVDSCAHRGAISHPQGRTIAVLGCGLDVVYPPENAGLFEQIASRGAVLSEYPLGTPPLADNFPRRNRIVSGMSRGVLVVEADERSGALITARQACDDHGRPVFAIPGRIDHALSAGPHKLIRDGATLVTKLEDILDGLGPLPQSATEPSEPSEPSEPTLFPVIEDKPETVSPSPTKPKATISPIQQQILTCIQSDPAAVDTIVHRTGLPAGQILQELTFLSLKGVVRRVDGQTYVAK